MDKNLGGLWSNFSLCTAIGQIDVEINALNTKIEGLCRLILLQQNQICNFHSNSGLSFDQCEKHRLRCSYDVKLIQSEVLKSLVACLEHKVDEQENKALDFQRGRSLRYNPYTRPKETSDSEGLPVGREAGVEGHSPVDEEGGSVDVVSVVGSDPDSSSTDVLGLSNTLVGDKRH